MIPYVGFRPALTSVRWVCIGSKVKGNQIVSGICTIKWHARGF